MTVTYTAEVATCKKFGCFIKLLARWRGSIYKIIWMDLILFLVLYYCINLIYFNILESESKRTFESIVYYCASYTSLIPLSFVLGFYVNLVMTRWWEQYITIPWPDSIAVFVSAHVHGQDEGGRLMRRTVMRYVCLCLTIVFTMISPCVKKRFPKLKNLVDAGLLLENEKQIIEAMDASFPNYPKHWMPIVWAASIITRARKESRIRDDFAVKTIIDELNSFRGRCGTLMYYDFISIPLVYTQVVTIAVYSFFLCSLLAHQWIENKKDTAAALDFYSPVFITLQFFFYMGWLKVAETLINPFGEDDDDFEVNWMIDRNLQVSYLIVDEMHHEHPELVRDQYWDEVYPNELPYESEVKREQPPEPSTAKYDLEDLTRRTTSKLPSLANSTIENGTSYASIQNALNRRSQRFNEAFQRFLSYSENDTTSATRSAEDLKTNFQSFPDIENIENITSYTYPDQVEFESQRENENAKERLILNPIIEEGEELSEAGEEVEMPSVEEENNAIETQSECESDSDSDYDSGPFERLRMERQQERLQQMNDYLERHFGTNFRIVTRFSDAHETKSESKAEHLIPSSNQYILVGEHYKDAEESNEEEEETLSTLEKDESLLTPTISTIDHVQPDINSKSHMIEVEKSEKLSKILSIQNTSPAALGDRKNYENQLQGGGQAQLLDKGNEEIESSTTAPPANILQKNYIRSNQAVSSEQGSLTYTPQAPTIAGSRISISPDANRVSRESGSISQIATEQGSHVPIAQYVSNASEITARHSCPTSQNQSCNTNLPKGNTANDAAPLDSARNMSIQSAAADDEENPAVVGEYRVEIEKSQDEHN